MAASGQAQFKLPHKHPQVSFETRQEYGKGAAGGLW